jgi:hypothetical protein
MEVRCRHRWKCHNETPEQLIYANKNAKNNVYIYNRVLFSLKEERNSDPCYNTGELQGPHVKQNKRAMKRQILYDSTYMWYQEEPISYRRQSGGFQELQGGTIRSPSLPDTEFPFGRKEK